MYTFGWTESDLEYAACRASDLVGTAFYCENVRVRSERCRRGGQTLQFILRPRYSAARLHGGGYPPGIKVDLTGKKPRSSGTPCYHAFGHFMRALFEINPEGKIKTGLATYDTMEGFDEVAPKLGAANVGGVVRSVQFAESCECPLYDVEDF